jgi:hypothetical protein
MAEVPQVSPGRTGRTPRRARSCGVNRSTAPSGHPGNRLHRSPQSRPRKPHRHPQPGPPRPHRPSRRDHLARRRTTPHRRRPNLHRHPRPRTGPRPPHPHHPRRHRRTPPRTNPEPHQGLPTHRRTKRPPTEKVPNLTQVRNYSDVLRHRYLCPRQCAPGRIRTCDTGFRRACKLT